MDSDRRSAAVVRELGLERVAVIGRILDVVVHGEEGAGSRLSARPASFPFARMSPTSAVRRT